MVSRRHSSLRLPLGSSRVDETVAAVAADLGWSLRRAAPNELVLSEDLTRLHCHCAPAEVRLTLGGQDPGETELEITGEVPGRGPAASQHVRRQTDLLTRRIGLAAARRVQSTTSAALRG